MNLPRSYRQSQQRTTNDDDQESGTGNSIPQSPFREHEASYVNVLDMLTGEKNVSTVKANHLSPFLSSCLLGDAQLSLCGNINNPSAITDELFNAQLISFEAFANNPAIINDPNLVVRINGKYVSERRPSPVHCSHSCAHYRYYNWSVASALITATSIFHKPLPADAVEQLQEKHMAQAKPRTTGSGWWGIPFYGKKVRWQADPCLSLSQRDTSSYRRT